MVERYLKCRNLSLGGSKAPYNWLTQSSLDTMAMSMSMSYSESQSSLMFTVGSTVKSSGKTGDHNLGKGFGKDRMGKKDATDGAGMETAASTTYSLHIAPLCLRLH